MMKKCIAFILASGLLVFAAGCSRIQEPWVRSHDQLDQERARSDQAQLVLRDRLLEVQTDR